MPRPKPDPHELKFYSKCHRHQVTLEELSRRLKIRPEIIKRRLDRMNAGHFDWLSSFHIAKVLIAIDPSEVDRFTKALTLVPIDKEYSSHEKQNQG